MVVNSSGANGNGSAVFFGTTFSNSEMSSLTNAGVVIGPGSGNSMLNLDRGRIFAFPQSDIVVQTHEGNLHIAAGSIAFVIETGHDVAVYNLHDERIGGVAFVNGKNHGRLEPGQVLVLTRDGNASFADINPGFNVGYRNVSKSAFGDGITAHVAEFAGTSVIAEVMSGVHGAQVHHGQLASAKNKMLKTAAALYLATGGHGSYSPGCKDCRTK